MLVLMANRVSNMGDGYNTAAGNNPISPIEIIRSDFQTLV